MRRTVTLLVMLAVGLASPVYSQSGGGFHPSSLEVSWQLVDNHYQDRAQFLSVLTLKNEGDHAIPPGGWSIYLNNMSGTDQTGNVEIEHINGDLSRLTPTSSFGGLEPGDSLELDLVAGGSALNISDAPIGLYWVWDADPRRGIPVDQYNVKWPGNQEALDRGPQDEVPVATPETVYSWNSRIRDIDTQWLPRVFPTPASYQASEGSFTLGPGVPVQYDPMFRNEAQYLSAELKKVFGIRAPLTTENIDGKKIIMQQGDTGPEGYELSITPEQVTISASRPAGIFYGIQSLKTALPPSSWSATKQSIDVPAIQVSDAPRFGHRAFMQDVSRNFRTKEQILKTLDLMSLYKLNVFHFHFNDDEGWRIEIPGLPELTTVGGQRGHTLDNHERLQPSYGSGPHPSYPGSGFYSTEDFIDILEYAAERHIKVIPEIETPGHARAAIKAMDARYRRLMAEGKADEARKFLLRDLDDTSEYRSVQGWDDNVIDVGLPSTYRFLAKVIDELQAMYEQAGAPLDRIHMGGDEVPSGAWEQSPAAQQLIAEHPDLQSTGDLWGYFFRRVNDMLQERGLSLYGWEEIGMKDALWGGETHSVADEAFAEEDVQVDVWNNVIGSGDEDLAYRLANAGYKVVLSGVSNFYFDLAYQKAFPEPGLYWGGFNSLEKPFSFIPYNYYKNAEQDVMGRPLTESHFDDMVRLTKEGRSNIVGIQSLLWGEKLIDGERQEYMLLPKLLAMAERAWAPQPAWAKGNWSAENREQYQQAWSEFLNIISKQELPRLDHYAGGFNYRIPTPGAILRNSRLAANVQLPGFTIRYTMDGSKPTTRSTRYIKPMAVSENANIRLRVFNLNGRGGRTITVSGR
ncbi:family 20 glycosylhydrolase [Halalkalibaculum sp. DA3122]|uniref:family 20 glycosylhydrolase n=1 Tax=Halalkalibaculum sp. DA3122 TaxID=3373607 RepID=UPI003754115B